MVEYAYIYGANNFIFLLIAGFGYLLLFLLLLFDDGAMTTPGLYKDLLIRIRIKGASFLFFIATNSIRSTYSVSFELSFFVVVVVATSPIAGEDNDSFALLL